MTTTRHAVTPAAMPVFVRLLRRLDELDAGGRPVPCRIDPDPFTSDDRRERAEAAASAEPWHVWGGKDCTPRTQRAKETAA